jgi:DNA-binding beta-propeller fold protein YncE
VYVADQLNHRIQHFSPTGELLQAWGSYGSVANETASPGTFNEPWGVAVGPDGSVYVSDTWNYRIQKFTSDGQFITMWGASGQGESADAFYGPRGLAVDAEGKVYVADTGNKRIVVFTSDGEYVTQFGTPGMELGELDEPVDVALDAVGNVYVTDTWNQRVHVFAPTPDNQFFPVLTWEINGWFSQSIDNKPYIAVDPTGGYVFVTDPEGYRILQFDLSGNFVRAWGDYSPDIDGFGLPIGVAVDQQGRVWVADAGNNRVMRFDLSGLPLPMELQPGAQEPLAEEIQSGENLQDQAPAE